MDHHLVLILTELLDRVALIRVAIKGLNGESLENLYSNKTSEKGELDASVAMALSLL